MIDYEVDFPLDFDIDSDKGFLGRIGEYFSLSMESAITDKQAFIMQRREAMGNSIRQMRRTQMEMFWDPVEVKAEAMHRQKMREIEASKGLTELKQLQIDVSLEEINLLKSKHQARKLLGLEEEKEDETPSGDSGGEIDILGG
jgi:hypothetical protein